MEDSLEVEEGMLVKFPLLPFATCLLHLQLLLQGSFQQEEVKQPHCRDTQRPNIINYLGPSLFARTVQPLWQEQPVKAHVGGPWSQPFLKNTARQIFGCRHTEG